MNDDKLSFGQVLGDSLGQVGRHWVFFVGVGLANVLLYLPGTYLVSHTSRMGPDSFATNMMLVYGMNFLNAVLSCLIYGTIIDFAHQVYTAPRPSAGAAVRLAFSRWPALVWTMVVRWFWLILGFALLLIPGLIWGYRQMLCWVVTTVEGTSGAAALRRSQALMNSDPSAYGIVFAQWLLCLALFLLPTMALGFTLIHQTLLVRTALQAGIGLLAWLVYGVYYFSSVRVYHYLRNRLDGTPEESGIGFSPSFEL